MGPHGKFSPVRPAQGARQPVRRRQRRQQQRSYKSKTIRARTRSTSLKDLKTWKSSSAVFAPCNVGNPSCSAGVRDSGATMVHADAKRRHLSSQPATRGGGTSKNLPPSSSPGSGSSSSLGRAGRAGMAPRTSFPGRRRRRLEGRTTRLEIG